MFVEINNADMNIFGVDDWINRTREASGGIISPEFAMEVLSKTNHFGHIKKVLKNIKDNCTTTEELMPYKEFILSCVDGREMSREALTYLCEMAEECGCTEELEKLNAKDKQYDVKACEKFAIIRSQEELENLKGTDLDVLFVHEKGSDCEQEILLSADFSRIKRLRFSELANIHIQGGENFPKYMDFSNCFSIVISHATLNGDENIKWASMSTVASVRNIPANTDLSNCRQVCLEHSSFAKDGELKVGGVCDLDFVTFPKKVDFSKCDGIFSAYKNGLYGVEEIKFRNKAHKRELISKLGEYNGEVVFEEVEKEISFADKLKKFLGREVG